MFEIHVSFITKTIIFVVKQESDSMLSNHFNYLVFLSTAIFNIIFIQNVSQILYSTIYIVHINNIGAIRE